jgi:hypothetical protein
MNRDNDSVAPIESNATFLFIMHLLIVVIVGTLTFWPSAKAINVPVIPSEAL